MAKVLTLNDTNPMSYDEFGKVVNRLIVQLDAYCEKNNLKFDIIVPILRSGGIPGSIIAVHFREIKILPIQLKCYPGNIVKQLLTVPQLSLSVPKSPNILICETNTSTGRSAKAAIRLLKDRYPDATLFYSTVVKVFGGPDKFDGVKEYFYGIQSDENVIATADQVNNLGLRTGITIFPWENADDELLAANIAAGNTL